MAEAARAGASSIKLTTVVSRALVNEVRIADGAAEFEDLAARERRAAMQVALSQPHRLGSDDQRLASELGRFCRDRRLRDECYEAGEIYLRIVEDEKISRGFRVPGRTAPDVATDPLDDRERLLRLRAAIQRLRASNQILNLIDPCLSRIVAKLVFDQVPPPTEEHQKVGRGLFALALDYGLLERATGGISKLYRLDIPRALREQ